MILATVGKVIMATINPDDLEKLSDAAQVELYLFILDELQRQQQKKSAPAFQKQGLIS